MSLKGRAHLFMMVTHGDSYERRKPNPQGQPGYLRVDTVHQGGYHANVLDEGVRESLAIVVDTSIPSGRVIRELDKLVELRGRPAAIRCDNGPEFCAQSFIDWCHEHGIAIRYIQPGKPNQNAFIERFNKSYRQEVLNAHLFSTLDQVREISEQWRIKYNEYRPHDALGRIPPAMYMRKLKLENSNYKLST